MTRCGKHLIVDLRHHMIVALANDDVIGVKHVGAVSQWEIMYRMHTHGHSKVYPLLLHHFHSSFESPQTTQQKNCAASTFNSFESRRRDVKVRTTAVEQLIPPSALRCMYVQYLGDTGQIKSNQINHQLFSFLP